MRIFQHYKAGVVVDIYHPVPNQSIGFICLSDLASRLPEDTVKRLVPEFEDYMNQFGFARFSVIDLNEIGKLRTLSEIAIHENYGNTIVVASPGIIRDGSGLVDEGTLDVYVGYSITFKHIGGKPLANHLDHTEFFEVQKRAI